MIPNKTSTLDGFVFLFQYTCLCILGSLSEIKVDIREQEKYEKHINNNKVLAEIYKKNSCLNIKYRTSFMLRRPLSEMWKNIEKSPDDSFKKIYNKKIKYERKELIKKIFPFIYYGNDYYQSNYSKFDFSPQRKNLIKKSDEVDFLLKNGVMTTSIMNLFGHTKIKVVDLDDRIISKNISDIFNHYHDLLIESIDAPTIRYDFNPEKCCVIERKTDYDLLSPPLFIDSTSSMGAYKDSSKIDLDYGEVIFEVRDLKNIATYALDQMGMGNLKGNFLTKFAPNKGHTFRDQVKELFDFVNDVLT